MNPSCEVQEQGELVTNEQHVEKVQMSSIRIFGLGHPMISI